ncbi:MAG: NAD-dependent epimerase/dehydratase family protein [Candidatus Tectomicrobia bacterium]|uniref:NAD-dependent epimerase/dehydratase family protein n=1 Tax=Tectimicrobiota bacterium TaxID=2528274 RepID=A0A932LZE0_UNCTE|nr:NAD-dependent epimerase/dehydratase family protein [Candidatus Tectomicrobia bacterium]
MTIQGKRIFLTGGAGFIGSTLAGRLLEDNEVVIYDSFERDALSAREFSHHKNLRRIRGDILDHAGIQSAMEGANIVVHLAAIAGVDTVIKSPTSTMRVNLLGTYNVLQAALGLTNCERVVTFSTSEVFGTYAYRVSEDDTVNTGAVGEARWTYAVSKLAGEHMSYAYFKEFALPTVIVRPFNVYGPGQVGEGAIHVFVQRSLSGQDLLIHGDGDQIRSWTYIDDMVDGILLVMGRPEAVGQSFNLGNPRGTVTVNGLAELILAVTGSSSKIAYVPRQAADVELRIPSIEKARTLLGFQPIVGLREGIERTVAWYRILRNNDR